MIHRLWVGWNARTAHCGCGNWTYAVESWPVESWPDVQRAWDAHTGVTSDISMVVETEDLLPHLIAAHEAPTHGVPAATVRQWAKRGKLYARGLDNNDRPLYLLADVLTLATPANKPASQA